MAATAALEAHRIAPDHDASLALAASALEGARRAQADVAAPDAQLATYLRLKACPCDSGIHAAGHVPGQPECIHSDDFFGPTSMPKCSLGTSGRRTVSWGGAPSRQKPVWVGVV